MKNFLLFLITALFVHAATAPTPALPSATITADTKLELTKTKGSIGLRAGSKVDVIGEEGDSLVVMYRNIPGLVPRSKTNFKGEAPKVSATPAATTPAVKANPSPAAAPVATAPSTSAKPLESKPAPATTTAAPSSAPREPVSTAGKMIKKASDVTTKRQETMVDPANELSGADKK
jgi:hypothetical protein